MLVFAVQQSESAVCRDVSLLYFFKKPFFSHLFLLVGG